MQSSTATAWYLRRCSLLLVLFLETLACGQQPRDHWAFQPLKLVPIPATVPNDAAQTPIDFFIHSRLAAQQLTMAAPADRATWLRRASYDLIGLPPTLDEADDFLADNSPGAYLRVIDRLLASPAYGERWGKYWLDVAGYADSNGYFHADTNRPYAYHYRDYVVRRFNADTPYDEFVRQQLAGDELLGHYKTTTVANLRALMVATHFLRNAPDGSSESDGNPEEVTIDRVTALEGSLQITMNSLLGLTIQCARCHEHKFEPIGQEEYYQLQAIFYPAFPAFHNDKWVVPVKRIGSIATVRQFRQWKEEVERIDKEIANLEKAKKKDSDRAKEVDEQIKQLTSRRPAQPGTVAWLTDVVAPAPDTFRLESGDYQAPAEKVTPAGLAILSERDTVLAPQPLSLPPLSAFAAHHDGKSVSTQDNPRPSTGRRLAFARWMTQPDSRPAALLARVIANRVWQYHFGTGLVRTPDNFGLSGSRPSHPQLLEYLAKYLVDHNWSVKSLHRLIMTSAVYQQASTRSGPPVHFIEVDSTNRLLWKYPLQRLDAEAIRDSLLAVSGELNRQLFGPYTPTERTGNGDVVVPKGHPDAGRRSIYLQQRRTQVATFLELFDAPSIVSNCSQRTKSTVPLQSLTLLNSEFILDRSAAFAARLNRFPHDALEPRISYSFRLLLGRHPRPAELTAALGFLAKQRHVYRDEKEGSRRLWTDYCQMLLATNAFLYLE